MSHQSREKLASMSFVLKLLMAFCSIIYISFHQHITHCYSGGVHGPAVRGQSVRQLADGAGQADQQLHVGLVPREVGHQHHDRGQRHPGVAGGRRRAQVRSYAMHARTSALF